MRSRQSGGVAHVASNRALRREWPCTELLRSKKVCVRAVGRRQCGTAQGEADSIGFVDECNPVAAFDVPITSRSSTYCVCFPEGKLCDPLYEREHSQAMADAHS